MAFDAVSTVSHGGFRMFLPCSPTLLARRLEGAFGESHCCSQREAFDGLCLLEVEERSGRWFLGKCHPVHKGRSVHLKLFEFDY